MGENNKSHHIDFSLSWLFAETDFFNKFSVNFIYCISYSN